MKEFVKVYDRVSNTFKEVQIEDTKDVEISDKTLARWQGYIDIIAKAMDIPSVLIMRLNENKEIEVFLTNNNRKDNPYEANEAEYLGKGLYCENVIANDDTLLVPNALNDDIWKDNPDVELNMVSYLGLPLKWGNDSVFGTVCVLDNKENNYNHKYNLLLERAKELIEDDLEEILKNSKK